MASDRLAELLRSRSELTEEEVNRMTESEAWQWIHASESKPGNALRNAEYIEHRGDELKARNIPHDPG